MKKRLGLLVMLLAILVAPVCVNAEEISSANGAVKVSDNSIEATDVLNVSNIDLTAAQKTAIETASNGQKVVGAYELSIDGIDEFTSKASISFKLTKELEAYDEFNIVEINAANEVIDEKGTEVKDGYITTTEYGHLGRFVIVACNKDTTPEKPEPTPTPTPTPEEPKKEEPKKEETKVENPKTFDGVTINVIGTVAGLSTMLGGTFLAIRKRA